MRARLGLVLPILLLFVAVGRADDSSDGEALVARLNSEAKVLFAQVIADEKEPYGRCGLDRAWSDYPVDEATAREALGLNVHASLQAPDYVAKPIEVIGPLVAKDVFCDKDERDRYLLERVAD